MPGEELRGRDLSVHRKGQGNDFLLDFEGMHRITVLDARKTSSPWDDDQKAASRLSRHEHLALVCGRYEGVDERVLSLVDEELSVGDYILSGGEMAALIVIDAVCRLVPGVIGNETSSLDESFGESLLEYPQYTRPQGFMDMEVPAVLLSGNHNEIRRWRRKESIRRTILRRPDLFERFEPTDEDRKLIREIMEEIPE